MGTNIDVPDLGDEVGIMLLEVQYPAAVDYIYLL